MHDKKINMSYVSSRNNLSLKIDDYIRNQRDTAIASLAGTKCDYYMNIGYLGDNQSCFLYSGTNLTRAGDLFRYIISGLLQSSINVIKEENDGDSVTSWCLAGMPVPLDVNDALEDRIEAIVQQYLAETVIINAGSYFERNRNEIVQWPIYQKKAVPRCCVDSKKLQEILGLEENSDIILKTLENQSGIVLPCNEDTFIMIGTNGEPYDIKTSKLEVLYELEPQSDTRIEMLARDYEGVPKAIIKATGEEINLLDYAVLCQPRKINQVYAKKIENGIVKVFSTRIIGTNNYYLGGTGDWITVDKDILTSVHIVAEVPFEKSYEKV